MSSRRSRGTRGTHEGGTRRGGGRAPEPPTSAALPTIMYPDARAEIGIRLLLVGRGGPPIPDAVLAGVLGAEPGGSVIMRDAYSGTVHEPAGVMSCTKYVLGAKHGERAGAVIMNTSYTKADGTRLTSGNAFLKSLRAQVEAADQLPIPGAVQAMHMKMTNALRADRIGLIRAGFDATLRDNERTLAETRSVAHTGVPHERVARARTISELIMTVDGARIWAREALNPDVLFDLRPGSASRRRLDAELRRRGLRGLTRI